MLEVYEKAVGHLGGRRRLLARVRTKAEGDALIADIGHKPKWLSYTVEEMSQAAEEATITDLEREERLLALQERKMELAERQTRLDLARKMAASAGKMPVDTEAAVRDFLAKGPDPKVTRPIIMPDDPTDIDETE